MITRYFPSKTSARQALRAAHVRQFGSSGVLEREPRRVRAKMRRAIRNRRAGVRGHGGGGKRQRGSRR
jgi:hypothetical protein